MQMPRALPNTTARSRATNCIRVDRQNVTQSTPKVVKDRRVMHRSPLFMHAHHMLGRVNSASPRGVHQREIDRRPWRRITLSTVSLLRVFQCYVFSFNSNSPSEFRCSTLFLTALSSNGSWQRLVATTASWPSGAPIGTAESWPNSCREDNGMSIFSHKPTD